MSDHSKTAYTSEFKESAVKLAIESQVPKAQTAKDLGINVNTLYTWIDKYSPVRGKGALMSHNNEHHFEEIKRLKRELLRVTEERDLLKKAAAYFAKEAR